MDSRPPRRGQARRRQGGVSRWEEDEDSREDGYTREDIAGLNYEPTSGFDLAQEEEFKVCPFDPLHVVPSSSFYKHKLKCERKEKERLGIPDAFNEMQYRNRYGSSIANQTRPPTPPLHVADLSLQGAAGTSASGSRPAIANLNDAEPAELDPTGIYALPTATATTARANWGRARVPTTVYWGSGPSASALMRNVGPDVNSTGLLAGVGGNSGPDPQVLPIGSIGSLSSSSPYVYVPDPSGGLGPSGVTESGLPLQVAQMAASNLRYFEPSGLTPAMRREFRQRRHAVAGYRDRPRSPPRPRVEVTAATTAAATAGPKAAPIKTASASAVTKVRPVRGSKGSREPVPLLQYPGDFTEEELAEIEKQFARLDHGTYIADSGDELILKGEGEDKLDKDDGDKGIGEEEEEEEEEDEEEDVEEGHGMKPQEKTEEESDEGATGTGDETEGDEDDVLLYYDSD